MRLVNLLTLIILLGCQSNQKPEGNDVNADTIAIDTTETEQLGSILADSTGSNQALEVNSDSSHHPLGLTILRDFELNGSNRAVKDNDSLFIEFLKAFTTYQNEMNDLLFDDPKYDTYNTLIYADESLVEADAKKFEDSVRNIGFLIAMSEGMIFLEKDPQFLAKFSQYLSERMNTFRLQYSKEIEYPLAEDGGIIISINEQINRMLFWEEFANKYPGFELPDYANDQFEMYLFYLMFGMDNTPIHDWSDSLNIRPELIKIYKQVIEKHPDSKATAYLTEYLKYLEQKNYKYDRSFNEYGREKFPDMYGN